MGMCTSHEEPAKKLPKKSLTLSKKPSLFPSSVPTLKYASRENIRNIYTFDRKLGEGKQGEVHFARSRHTIGQYAIKSIQIHHTLDGLHRLESEINTLR